jgi:uncharacterized protein (TIGR02453 family)
MPTPHSPQRHFTPGLFRFMRDLEAHNDREWFADNKDRYLADLRDPALEFVVDFGSRLVKISPHFLADPRPNGGALFRIYRDIRFSKDKRPYKDHAGLHFRHAAGKGAHTPGFYLHMQPGNSFVGVGLWRPDNPTLKLIRDALVADPGLWKKAVGGKNFRQDFRVSGESLKRPPKGYDPDHPLIDILKMKDFTAYAPLTQKQITAPSFLDEFARLCKAGGSLVKFLCEATGQPF